MEHSFSVFVILKKFKKKLLYWFKSYGGFLGQRKKVVPPRHKGLQRQRLIGSAVAGFNHAKTITKASPTYLHARQDDYNKGT